MNIVITGASSGIGYATALKLSEEPANKVIAISRRADLLRQLQKATQNSNIIPLAFDLVKGDFEADLYPVITANVDTVDVLINNAGLLKKKPFEKLTDKEWLEIYNINCLSVVKLIRYLLPLMGLGLNPSHIINIGSMGGVQGSVKYAGLSAYSSSKAALAGITECLAEELKSENIAINMLALGSVQTDMFSQAFPDYKAPLRASEIAEFINWFSQEGAKYFNGKIIPVSSTTP
jgi:3-oxoacyl-[acyl-carrier protein] reductase